MFNVSSVLTIEINGSCFVKIEETWSYNLVNFDDNQGRMQVQAYVGLCLH